jgi:hypothetical protein
MGGEILRKQSLRSPNNQNLKKYAKQQTEPFIIL